MSVSKSPRAASIHFVNCGCLALRFWLPLLVTGMGLWANPGSGQAAEASATQYRYDYFYVKNGDAITKVEASPSAAKPDWWVACFYKPGETPDGSSKGQWGQLSQKNLGDLMVEVKKRQEQEINDKYPPVGGVIMT